MLAPDELWTWWQAEFGDCPPIGHRLRDHFLSRRWIRFHSLPASKRYADDDAERAEILRRHDAIATALFGHGAPIAILRTGYSMTPTPVAPEASEARRLRVRMRSGPSSSTRPIDRREPGCDSFTGSDATDAVPAIDLAFLRSIAVADLDDPDAPPGYWHVWMTSARWAANRFHALFAAIASDELDDVLLVSVERRAVFAPYDGGVDVIAADRFVCDALGREFQAWRPTTPTGL